MEGEKFDLKTIFQTLIEKDKLFHGYIFWGQVSGEKEIFKFACSLANYLENKVWETSTRPLVDVLVVNSALVNGQESSMGIDTARQMSGFLWQKPLRSLRKTLIVSGAGLLTTQAQNALLKITEEPPPHGLILLIINNPENLLAPLVSRFQKIYFPTTPNTPINSKGLLKNIDKDFVARLVENDDLLNNFIAELMTELNQDPINNHERLKELLYRWSVMNQYNVNKKLQLESLLQWIKL